MSLIKITKTALQERRELDLELSDPNYWDRLVDKHCSKPADDDDGSSGSASSVEPGKKSGTPLVAAASRSVD